MNITFDPLNPAERSVVLALLGNLEAPAIAPVLLQPLAAAAPADPPAEKPKRKKKDDTAPVSVGTAALDPAMVDKSQKLADVTKALAAEAVAANPAAPLLTPTQQALLAAPLQEVKSIGEQLAQTQALTRDDMRDLLSTYAKKGAAEAEFAKDQLKDCQFKLSLLAADKYATVAAALAEKGWTLDLARAAAAAAKAQG